MFRFNIKQAIRNFLRNKVYSLINLVGLSIGLAGTFIILLYLTTEISYDNHHELRDHIYRINSEDQTHNMTYGQTPYILATTLNMDLTEDIKSARIFNLYNSSVKLNNEYIKESKIFCADNELFEIFTYNVIEGSKENFLTEPYSVVLTNKMANKYFGTESPLGKTLSIENNGDIIELNVTGVIEDMPVTSTFTADFITNIKIAIKQMDKLIISTYTEPMGDDYHENAWHEYIFFTTYLLLPEEYPPDNIDEILAGYKEKYLNENINVRFYLQPLKDIYFKSSHIFALTAPSGNLKNIYIFSAIALLVILTASLNYIILSTARSVQRAKEIGLKKVIGASRRILIRQILGESVMMALLTLPISISLAELLLPHVCMPLFNKQLTINYFTNWEFTIGFILISMLIGIFSGSYIAFYLVKFNPNEVLKSLSVTKQGKSYFRKSLIVIQLVIFITLMICTITIYNQLNFARNKDLGFNTDNILSINFNNEELRKNSEAIKNEILSYPYVLNISGAMWSPPTNSTMSINIPKVDDNTQQVNVEGLFVDFDIVKTLGLNLIEGRDFSREFGNEERKVIINEKCIETLGITEAIGTETAFGTVIGVVSDFHLHSLHKEIPPMIIAFNSQSIRSLLVKLNPENFTEFIESLGSKWGEYSDSEPFECKLLSDSFDELYSEDKRFGKFIGVFTSLAIFIALLGLFGMSLFSCEQRSKEIGIRKVMGASSRSILVKLSGEFLVLVIIALFFAFPTAYYFMNKWLQNFEFASNIKIWIFILTTIISCLVVLLTVSFQSRKAANSNPVNTLRYE